MSCSPWSASPRGPIAAPTSSPAASANGWRWPGRGPATPRVRLLAEPCGALDAKVRAELRRWLRRLHDEQGVTTVLVTHDQEEAMEVADTIAVMNKARIEQVGAPREVYDKPANPFVMGFLGPVSTVDGKLVRPHDVTLSVSDGPGLIEAMVKRV